MCVDHYLGVEVLNRNYEGFDQIEIWKKQKSWKKTNTDKTVREINEISDFLDILVSTDTCGKIILKGKEFNFIKYVEKSDEFLELGHEIDKKDILCMKLLLCIKLAFPSLKISPSISLPSSE